MGDFGQEGEVCGDGVVKELEVGLLLHGEFLGVVDDWEVDVCVREGGMGLFGEGFELFY